MCKIKIEILTLFRTEHTQGTPLLYPVPPQHFSVGLPDRTVQHQFVDMLGDAVGIEHTQLQGFQAGVAVEH